MPFASRQIRRRMRFLRVSDAAQPRAPPICQKHTHTHTHTQRTHPPSPSLPNDNIDAIKCHQDWTMGDGRPCDALVSLEAPLLYPSDLRWRCCATKVDLSAPGLRELYADRTAPRLEVEVLCPHFKEHDETAGKCSSSSSPSSSSAAAKSSLTTPPTHTHRTRRQPL